MFPIATFVMETLKTNTLESARKVFANLLLATSHNRTKCYRVTDRLLRHGVVSMNLARQLPQLLNVSKEQIQVVLADNEKIHSENYQSDMFKLFGAHVKVRTGAVPLEQLMIPIYFNPKQIIQLPWTILNFPKRQQLSIVQEHIQKYVSENASLYIPYYGRIVGFDYIYSPTDLIRLNLQGEVLDKHPDPVDRISVICIGSKHVKVVR